MPCTQKIKELNFRPKGYLSCVTSPVIPAEDGFQESSFRDHPIPSMMTTHLTSTLMSSLLAYRFLGSATVYKCVSNALVTKDVLIGGVQVGDGMVFEGFRIAL